MECVLVEVSSNMGLVRLNRPGTYNSFDLETIKCLGSVLRELRKDRGVYGLVITGEGKAFCTGGDLRWVAADPKGQERALHELAAHFHQAIVEIKRMPKPVVAAINGVASGGGFSMALACDFRIMERSAILKQGYTSNGLSVDGGLSFTLPRLVGLGKAMEILALDPRITAQEAFSWGLVNKVVEDGESLKASVEILERLKNTSADSFSASKGLLHESYLLPFELVLERERELLAATGGSANGVEGVRAFLEKRPARYSREKGL